MPLFFTTAGNVGASLRTHAVLRKWWSGLIGASWTTLNAGTFLAPVKIRAKFFNSPVVEPLNRGLLSVWSPTGGRLGDAGAAAGPQAGELPKLRRRRSSPPPRGGARSEPVDAFGPELQPAAGGGHPVGGGAFRRGGAEVPLHAGAGATGDGEDAHGVGAAERAPLCAVSAVLLLAHEAAGAGGRAVTLSSTKHTDPLPVTVHCLLLFTACYCSLPVTVRRRSVAAAAALAEAEEGEIWEERDDLEEDLEECGGDLSMDAVLETEGEDLRRTLDKWVQKPRVLVCAPSNAAVDVLLERTRDARVYSHGGPIRRGTCGYILTADQSDAGRAGIFSRRTNQTRDARVYSHGGPIRRETCGYILTADQSDAGRAGKFSRRTNQTRGARVYSHGGPIRRRARGYILMADQSDADARVYSRGGPIRRRTCG
eukprot:1182722-Prorocentrum_minimum.AAC.1